MLLMIERSVLLLLLIPSWAFAENGEPEYCKALHMAGTQDGSDLKNSSEIIKKRVNEGDWKETCIYLKTIHLPLNITYLDHTRERLTHTDCYPPAKVGDNWTKIIVETESALAQWKRKLAWCVEEGYLAKE
jgi:hypothetical protein